MASSSIGFEQKQYHVLNDGRGEGKRGEYRRHRNTSLRLWPSRPIGVFRQLNGCIILWMGWCAIILRIRPSIRTCITRSLLKRSFKIGLSKRRSDRRGKFRLSMYFYFVKSAPLTGSLQGLHDDNMWTTVRYSNIDLNLSPLILINLSIFFT